MKIAESVSECKESTKESQGEVFSGIMGHRPKTIDYFEGLWKDYEKQSTIIKDNQPFQRIMKDND